MKIVIAPNAFKGSLSAIDVAAAISKGLQVTLSDAEFLSIPMADGGDGTLECILKNLPAKQYQVMVQGPLQDKQQASFGILQDNTALIEMALSSGLRLVPTAKLDPMHATSRGTGELILAALNKGCRKFIIGLGGSATCDGGMGALSALGLSFKDHAGNPIAANGEGMLKVASIDSRNLDPRLLACEFILAHDVDNPLLGLQGALMYAPQKGANAASCDILHKGYENFHYVISQTTDKNIGHIPGTGAAGGMGAGLLAFLNARLVPGAALVMDMLHFKEKIFGASLIITAEGKIDAQTSHGKACSIIAKLAKTQNIPVIIFTAIMEAGFEELYKEGVNAVFSIAPGPISVEESLHQAKSLLTDLAFNIGRLIKIGNL